MKSHTTDTITIDGKEFFTRAWVMQASGLEYSREEATRRHRAYYGQFVTPAIENIVRAQFKREWPAMVQALANGEKYFNGITELRKWDALSDVIKTHAARKVTLCSNADAPRGIIYWSLSEAVCIAKEAARLMIERENKS